jgi:hypothetical protein
MMKLLLPVGLSALGLGAGAGIGVLTRPAPVPQGEVAALPEAGPRDYVRLNNQFVVPVLNLGQVEAFVILSISLEVTPGGSETVYSLEAKLRDAFLAALFEHSNAGGFRGTFTAADRMHTLRAALFEAAQIVLGQVITDVLIVDLVRQDA